MSSARSESKFLFEDAEIDFKIRKIFFIKAILLARTTRE